MTLIQSFWLGLIQSLTEFLPVSSSGHLILIPALLHWPDQGLAFDVMIHLGTAAAAMIYFRRDLLALLDWPRSKHLLAMILLSLLPTFVFGLLLKDTIEIYARHVSIVAFNLILWGLVLIAADIYSRRQPGTKGVNAIQWPQALMIGLAQSLALVPGTSRSGATLAVALFLGVLRPDAVKYSFMIGIPAMLGAGLLSLIDVAQGTQALELGSLAVGFSVSLLGGLAAIHLLMTLLRSKAITYFGIYRIVLGLILWRVL